MGIRLGSYVSWLNLALFVDVLIRGNDAIDYMYCILIFKNLREN